MKKRYEKFFKEIGRYGIGLPTYGGAKRRSLTINKDDKVYKVTVWPKLYCGNIIGFNVIVNNEKIFKNTLTDDEAIELAINTYQKKFEN